MVDVALQEAISHLISLMTDECLIGIMGFVSKLIPGFSNTPDALRYGYRVYTSSNAGEIY